MKTLLENQPHDWVFFTVSQSLERTKLKICHFFLQHSGVLQKLLIFWILTDNLYEQKDLFSGGDKPPYP